MNTGTKEAKKIEPAEASWDFLDNDEEEEELDYTLGQTGNGMQLVTFILGEEKYGMDILKVRELIRYTNITTVPNMPDFIRGVINLRGIIIPVLDMRIRFGMPVGHYNQYTVIIIVQVLQKLIGIIVDAVSDVVFLPKELLRPAPEFSSMVDNDFIEGMGQVRDDLIILLNIERILSPEEIHLFLKGSSVEERHERGHKC